MHTTNLRKVGGSVMMIVPPDLLAEMNVHVGSKVGMTVEDGKLIAAPARKRRRTFEERLAMCDLSAPFPADHLDVLKSGPVGEELL